MRLLGAVLAGGRSTRFGSDKALALLDGQPLLVHAATVLAPVVAAVVICGRGDDCGGLAGVPDWPATDLGPLGGICGALRHAVAQGFDAVVTIGCDMPVLPPELLTALSSGEGACFVRQAPVIGRWPVATFAPLERHLADAADRSVMRWARMIGAVPIDAGSDLPNFNHAEALAAYALSRAC